MPNVEQREVLSMAQVLAGMRAKAPEALASAYIVGHWVWAQFDGKPSQEIRDQLKALGFRFNARRKVWQNSCGWRSVSSPHDPRFRYGVVPAAEVADKLAESEQEKQTASA